MGGLCRYGSFVSGAFAKQVSRGDVSALFRILSDTQGEDREAERQGDTMGYQGSGVQCVARSAYDSGEMAPLFGVGYADGGVDSIFSARKRHIRHLRYRPYKTYIPVCL